MKTKIFSSNKTKKLNNTKVINEFDEKPIIKFDSLSYDNWYKIVQYVINYDMTLSNLERLDMMLERKKQLNAFLKCKGIIPEQYHNILQELNNKYQEMINIQNEIEINDLELSKRINDEKLLKSLKEELRNQMVNKDNLKFAKDHILYFRNPYFLDGNEQYFEKRYKSLKKEYKNIKSSIKEIKPYQKKYLRFLTLLEEQAKKALLNEDFDFQTIFSFVRPFINEIINAPDFYYSKLLSISLLN